MSEENSTNTNAYVQFVEDEDIYIECRPVDITGEVIMESSSNILPSTINNKILDELTSSVSLDSIHTNIGFQTLLGIILISILYGIGNFIFKNIPKKVINKRLY